MFKVLAYLMLAIPAFAYLVVIGIAASGPADVASNAWWAAAVWVFITIGWPCALTAGVFLCIHKYLHRGDVVYRDTNEFFRAQRPSPESQRPREPIVPSAFGR